ncbi:MAG: hypothetical protein FIB06_13370 [Betaproteobacteria bacterium]|nr:hypothetical protein [Betaproteobacteria bacterium]
MLTEARQRFANQPWLAEVLENMVRIAHTMDAAHFCKEAAYSAKKELLASLELEATAPSFLHWKTAQGKAHFSKWPDETQK